MKNSKEKIEMRTIIKASQEAVWNSYTNPEHIMKWNSASDDWHSPHAENDLNVGGRFLYRMEAKDGSYGFDFTGKFDEIDPFSYIAYTLDDDRKVDVIFTQQGDQVEVVQTFEAEDSHSIEDQRSGWQAILDNFMKYTETHF